jgi:hypothetical protein
VRLAYEAGGPLDAKVVAVKAHNDWCWPPTRSDVMVIVYGVNSVVFFPLKSMIRSIEKLVQMEKSLPRVLGILLEAKELLYIGMN